jgi:hypothetical protein
MKLRDNSTGHIFHSEMEFRQAYSNVSFPSILDDNALQYANVSIIVETAPPEITPTQRVQYDGVTLIDDKWTEIWSIHPLYDDPAQQANWEAECIDSKWNEVRSQRDILLTACDFTQMPDTPITPECKQAFIVYRQQLRNITYQTDIDNIVWPITPEYIKST